MADIIHLLPDSVANQIAAGEVIQRPSSVVKELLENSLDAGATEIQIWLQDAGKTSIIVSDNGKGMSETDARLAFERHATSKISEASDLYALHTMGFRGEALPSIAAVSQVELKTKTIDEELGVHLMLSGSKINDQAPIACKVGATFIVKNLFYNVPARRKFLKSNQTEMSNVITEFERFALAHSDVRLSLFHNKSQLYILRSENIKERIIDLYGTKLEKQLLTIEVNTSIVKISGYVGMPSASRSRGAHQFFFVNGRYMRHPYFHRAICSVFENLVKVGEQVPYFIYFEVDPSRIDVNIHPTKTEIKFEDEQAIWQILVAALREVLAKYDAVPTIDFDVSQKPHIPVFQSQSQPRKISLHFDESFNPFEKNEGSNQVQYYERKAKDFEQLKNNATSFDPLQNAEDNSSELFLYSQESESETSAWKEKTVSHYLYKEKYILTSVRSGLMIVDSQRAQERVMYDRFLSQITEHTCPSQGLIFPEIIHLSPGQRVIYNSIESELRVVGFDFSDYKGTDLVVNAIPIAIEGLDVVSTLYDLLENSKRCAKSVSDEILGRIALIMSKKASSKVGVLTNEAMNSLMDELFACKLPNYTEDGKLIVTILPHEKVEAMFK